VLRSQALAYLRTRGPVAARAADLLTAGFPQRTLSVPVLVRACRVDGHDAILVVEAWGGGDRTLDRRRLWVFDRLTGNVIAAAAFR
jgi:predicted transglutaminase-like cysteine proteinase